MKPAGKSSAPSTSGSTGLGPAVSKGSALKSDSQDRTRGGSGRKCFNCGLEGHMARVCTYI